MDDTASASAWANPLAIPISIVNNLPFSTFLIFLYLFFFYYPFPLPYFVLVYLALQSCTQWWKTTSMGRRLQSTTWSEVWGISFDWSTILIRVLTKTFPPPFSFFFSFLYHQCNWDRITPSRSANEERR